jgi:hypothetical protein
MESVIDFVSAGEYFNFNFSLMDEKLGWFSKCVRSLNLILSTITPH